MYNNTKEEKSKEYSEIVFNIINKIRTVGYLEQYKSSETDFTRSGVLDIITVAKTFFDGITTSLSSYMSKIFKKDNSNAIEEKYNITKDTEVSKQAFSEARKKLKSDFLIDLNESLINYKYEDETNVNLYDNKFMLIAADGCISEIPNTSKLREEFGHTTSQKGAKQVARAGTATIFDPLNKTTIVADILKYPMDERKILKEQIKKMKKITELEKYTKMLIMDRGYFSEDMLSYLFSMGIFFMFRLKTKVLKDYIDNMKENDQYIELSTKRLIKKSKDEETIKWLEQQGETIKVRLTKVVLSTGEVEILLSNIDMVDIPYEKMKELYFIRWQIEENYKFLKSIVEMQNFSGKTKITIEQDYHASILRSNIVWGYKVLADLEITNNEQSTENKFEYQANKNYLFSVFKECVFDIFVATLEQMKIITNWIISKAERIKVEICDGTKHEVRKINKRAGSNRYRTNFRRAC